MRRDGSGLKDFQMVKVGAECSNNQTGSTSEMKKMSGHSQPQTPEQIGQGQARTSEESVKTEGDLKKTQTATHD
ncbi:Leucine zipper protein 2 [Triplophysa tibetana]|nr:Leucine zipper protein 2 [Triplophysa tibetana]